MRKSTPGWRADIRLLVDTQVLVQAHLGTLPARVQQLLAPIDVEVCICAASLVEIATKNAIGKLAMSEGETKFALSELRIEPIAFEPSHALGLFSLPMHHRDPFDRMILATALSEGLPIVTGDRIFRRYSGVKVIW